MPSAAMLAPAPFRVTRSRRETPDTVTLDLEPAGNLPFQPANPGQFNMLYAFGAGEAPISISGGSEAEGPVTHTLRAVGAVTRSLCKKRVGDVIGVRGPFGAGWPVDAATPHDLLIVAGGIGLAPLRPVLYHVQRHRERYGNVSLLYGARSPEGLLYMREYERWRRSGIQVLLTVDHATPKWSGEVGAVTGLIPQAGVLGRETHAMMCGPEIMMRFVLPQLRELGLNSENIYVSMERNMQCGVGLCGHCQYGPEFICKDGPVFPYRRVQWLFNKKEI